MMWALLLVPVLGYVGFASVIFFSQSSLVHLPNMPGRELTSTPQDVGLAYESVNFPTADGLSLHGWFVPADGLRGAPAGTLLFLHGNAGNISHRLDSLIIFNRLGLDTLILDYRGYGLSEGKPSEQGLYRDAEAALRYLASERGVAPQETIIFGRSLGGAVAAWLAARHPPRALILESTFTSVPDMAAEIYPFLPTGLLARLNYDARKNLTRVHSPILVIHSRDDDIVPFDHGRRLYEVASRPKTFIELRGDHNMGFLHSREIYEAALAEFLDSLSGRAGS